jgi:hypothetical protein
MSPVTLIFGFLSALTVLTSPAPALPSNQVELQVPARIKTEPGACCIMFAPCQLLTEAECAQLGGTFMGEGVSCDVPMICPLWGACCMPDGSCSVDNDESCGAVGILFIANVTCDPNPCIEGACCRSEDGSCVQDVQSECGGTWTANTSCSPNPCIPTGMGACCFADGHCDILTAPDCQGQQGHFVGTGIACNPYPCSPVPVEKTTWGRIKVLYR